MKKKKRDAERRKAAEEAKKQNQLKESMIPKIEEEPEAENDTAVSYQGGKKAKHDNPL